MNTWFLAGEVLKHGVKGSKQYPTLWIQTSIISPDASIQGNKCFINFSMDANLNSKNGRIGEAIKNKLETCKFFFLQDAMIALITTGKKNDKGEWENEEVPGVRAKLHNLSLSLNRFDDINTGIVSGTVSKYKSDGAVEKFIVDERYRNPKTNEWKTRPIPILNTTPIGKDITGSSVFVQAALCGTTPNRESKTFGWAKRIILT